MSDEVFEGLSDVLIKMVGNPRWQMDFLDWRGILTPEWKYTFDETGKELRFDLVNEPYKRNNLVNTPSEKETNLSGSVAISK